MAQSASSRFAPLTLLAKGKDLVLPVGIIASVLVVIVPLPTSLMDLLLAANVSVAIIVLLTTIYVRTPLEFSIFPSLLLTTTLGRLVLNIATTRLILTNAPRDSLHAAGGVIRGFGEFVAGDNIVIGLILFIIIVIIQFVVITKGATRISEVAARFALDGMPGRQMAIDADLNAGIIDEKEAQRRRAEITQQADFFGAMDGASKFVRGDAIAGIIITLVNIVGGLLIGVIQSGMTVGEAAALFTKLTIGDGLVSQIPAFLISLAAGLLVTRSSTDTNLPSEFLRQLFSRPHAMIVTSGFLAILAFTNLPAIPLLTIGGCCSGLALVLTKQSRAKMEQASLAAKEKDAKLPDERIEDYMVVDPMELEIGVGLIRLADPKRGGDLLDRIQRVRQNVAAEVGIIMPKVRIRDNMRLDQNSYRIKLMDIPVADGTLYPQMFLAIDSSLTTGKIAGLETMEPAFNTPAVWIEPGARGQAEMYGYTVVEPASVIATHITEVVRRHADEILTRDATKHLVDELKQSAPAVVDELIPAQMKLAELQQILQILLREGVPIRQLATIMEALGDYASRTKDPVLLTEYVRHRLARTISTQYRDSENRLFVVTLDPALEDRIRAGTDHGERGLFIKLPPNQIEAVTGAIAKEVEKLTTAGHSPVLLVAPQVRPAVKQAISARLSNVVVISYNEITRDTQVESMGMVSV